MKGEFLVDPFAIIIESTCSSEKPWAHEEVIDLSEQLGVSAIVLIHIS